MAALNDLGGSAFLVPMPASKTEKIKDTVGISKGGISFPASFSSGENKNYASQLVPSTTGLLQKLGLENVDLYVQNLPQEAECGAAVGEPVKIKWSQGMKTREELYRKVHYVLKPDTKTAPPTYDPANSKDDGQDVPMPIPSPILVYVAALSGNPPAKFNTKGVSLGTGATMGTLHCGYVYLDAKDNDGAGAGALFFVIHPTSWEPFQKRFNTSVLTALVGTGISAAADKGGAAAGTVIGAAVGSIIPGVGNLIGAAVGMGVGYLIQKVADGKCGDYLRYVGSA